MVLNDDEIAHDKECSYRLVGGAYAPLSQPFFFFVILLIHGKLAGDAYAPLSWLFLSFVILLI